MIAGLVLLSAFLHALWNALLKAQAEKDLAGVAVVGAAWVTAVGVATASWAQSAAAPFPDAASVAWSAAAGAFEAAYFVALVRALQVTPLGVAYTVSRGAAVLCVWPLSVALLDEPITPLALAGTALLMAGVAATSLEEELPQRGVGVAALCGLFIAGYHLCYKQAMATGAAPPAVFALAMAVAFPLNLASLGRARLPSLLREVRARPLTLLALGAVCSGSFLVFLLALAQGGAGLVLTLRNTSIVFAALLGGVVGEALTRRRLLGAALVSGGAIVLGLGR